MPKLSNPKETYSAGSSLEAFLEEEGLLLEVEAAALKKVLAYQFQQAMKTANLSTVEMAKRMRTNTAAVERLINPNAKLMTLTTLAKAATALGMRLNITLEGGPR